MTTRTLELLHWNDVHGRFEGLARLSARARQIRAEADHPMLVLDGGDVEESSVRLSALTKGVAGWRLLGAAGVDAAVVGNGGLFRYGPGQLPHYAEALGSAPLVCDLTDAAGETPAGAAPYRLLKTGDLRVGVIGITDYYSAYDDFGLAERGRLTACTRAARTLRADGADVVVMLSHAGLEHDRGVSWHLRGLVDVIVGGHTHHLLDGGAPESGIPIVQAGCYAEHLGRVRLEIDADGVRVVDMRVEPVGEDVSPDPVVLDELAACERDLDAWLAEPVGVLDQAAPWAEPGEDSPVARLLAQALLSTYPAELGLVVGLHCTAGLAAGTLTRGDVWAATSSPGNAATCTLTGAQLRRMVRIGSSREYAARSRRAARGRFGRLHVVGDGVTQSDGQLMVGGKPLDDERRYRVTGSDFELGQYGELLDSPPEDLVVHTPEILPELLEAHLTRASAGTPPDARPAGSPSRR